MYTGVERKHNPIRSQWIKPSLTIHRPLHGIRHSKIRSSQCACWGQKVNSIPLNCVLTREFLVKTKLRAVTVADFYHRGGNGPTTAGGAVL